MCIRDSINSGSDDDAVCIIGATISGDTRIRTGSGDDSVTIGVSFGGEEPDVQFGDDVNIGLGGGDDNIWVNGTQFGSNSVRLNGNAGEDCYFFFDNDVNLEAIAVSLEEDCFDDEG